MLNRKERDFWRGETKQGEKDEALIETVKKNNNEKTGCLRREKCGDKERKWGRNEEKRTWGEMRT